MRYQRLLVIGQLAILVLVGVGCTATSAEIQETVERVVPTRKAEAKDIEAHSEHEASCDTANVPLPTEADVTVRFSNATGNEMTVIWRDPSQSPPQLVEYATVPAGEVHDQETFTGDEWVLRDHDGNTLEYVATSDQQQYAILHHWTYEGETGPENWAELREEYESCGIGTRQSPIDLLGARAADLPNIVFEYGETPVNLLNNGHTIQVDQIASNSIVLDGVTYPLRQFHFHAPSEHIEGGEHYSLEMHLVHRLDSGKLAVVGVFIAAGGENRVIAPVWDQLATADSPAVATDATINVAGLLPDDRQVYAYSGSLTTPPCSEEVKWFVMNEPIEMSAQQIAAYTDIMSGTNRPLQDVEGRNVMLDNTP